MTARAAAEAATRALLEAPFDPAVAADAAAVRVAAPPKATTRQRGRTGTVAWDPSKHKRGPGGKFAAGGGGSTAEAQRQLHRQGLYHGQIDAQHGPQTAAAVKAFQERYGIKPTGKLDANTVATMQAPPPKSDTDLRAENAKKRAETAAKTAAKAKGGKTTKTGRSHGGTAAAPGRADWQGNLSATGVLRAGDGTKTKGGKDSHKGAADVQLLQAKLEALGFDLGDAGPDGKFGSATTAAVKAFQRAYGLDPDGVVGRHTKLVLNLLGQAEGQPDPNALSIDQTPLSRQSKGGGAKQARAQLRAAGISEAGVAATTEALVRMRS